MKSSATTVEEYLNELPPERREVVARVRETVLKHLPRGYVETMRWGMISYEIPLSVFSPTYNGQPLSYAALAAQKNYYALYLMGVYGDPSTEARLRDGFQKAGKKLDMGKACLRFRKLEDLPLEVIGATISGLAPAELIDRYQKVQRRSS